MIGNQPPAIYAKLNPKAMQRYVAPPSLIGSTDIPRLQQPMPRLIEIEAALQEHDERAHDGAERVDEHDGPKARKKFNIGVSFKSPWSGNARGAADPLPPGRAR